MREMKTNKEKQKNSFTLGVSKQISKHSPISLRRTETLDKFILCLLRKRVQKQRGKIIGENIKFYLFIAYFDTYNFFFFWHSVRRAEIQAQFELQKSRSKLVYSG